MSAKADAHRQFVEFIEAYYRAHESELQYVETDPDSPIAFDVQIDGVDLTVGYDPDCESANFFVHCVFGAVPLYEEAPVLRRLLELNVALAREHNACYCIDRNTAEVVCYLRRSTAGLDVRVVREALTRMARQAVLWRRARFLGEGGDGEQGDDQGVIGPWQVLG